MPRYRPLTAAEREAIANLRRSGLTGHEIARRIGRSKSVVYKYFPSERLRPRWTESEMQVLVDDYAKQKPPGFIAAKIGRSTLAVKIAMCRYRKKVRSDPVKCRAVGYIARCLAAGLTPGQAINAIRRADIMRRNENDLQL